MDVQKWQGRGDNPLWLLLLPLLWLAHDHLHLLDIKNTSLESQIPLFIAFFATLLFLRYTESRFHLLIDAHALYYSSQFRQEYIPLSDIRSIKMQNGKLVIKTSQRKYRLSLPGLSSDDKSNMLAAVVRSLPDPIRAVA
ncbi:MAG: hypothetical protein ABSH19_05705 [Opitutales bacterium]